MDWNIGMVCDVIMVKVNKHICHFPSILVHLWVVRVWVCVSVWDLSPSQLQVQLVVSYRQLRVSGFQRTPFYSVSEFAFLVTWGHAAAAIHVSLSTVSSRCSCVFKCGRTSSTFKTECIWLVSSYVPLLFFNLCMSFLCLLGFCVCACVYYTLIQLYCSLLLGVWILPWKIPWTGWYPAIPFSVYLTVLWLGVLFRSLSERAMVLKAL